MSLKNIKNILKPSGEVVADKIEKTELNSLVEELNYKEGEHAGDCSDDIPIMNESDKAQAIDSSKGAQNELVDEDVGEESKNVCKDIKLRTSNLVDPGDKPMDLSRENTNSRNVKWNFLIFTAILIIALIGILSQLWLGSSATLILSKRIDELTVQNDILRLEMNDMLAIVQSLKTKCYEKSYDHRLKFVTNKHKWLDNGDSKDEIFGNKTVLHNSNKCDKGSHAEVCIQTKNNPSEQSKTFDSYQYEQRFLERSKNVKDRKYNSVSGENKDSSEERKYSSKEYKEKKHKNCKDCKPKHYGKNMEYVRDKKHNVQSREEGSNKY